MISLAAILVGFLTLSCNAFVAPTRTLRPSTKHIDNFKDNEVYPISAPQKTKLNAIVWNDMFFGKWQTIPSKKETIMIQPSQRLAIFFITLGAALGPVKYARWALGVPSALFGLLLAKQTRRVRVVFDEDNRFCLKTKDPNSKTYSKKTGRNKVTGTDTSSWNVDSIVNYDFFPNRGPFNPKGGLIGPVICYFKERETPRAVWTSGIIGAECNDPERIKNREAISGQAHFMPALFNAGQLSDEFEKRGCRKLAKKRED